MVASDETGVGVSEVAAVVAGEADAAGAAVDAPDDGGAVVAVVGKAAVVVAAAGGGAACEAAAVVAVLLLLVLLAVNAALSLLLSVAATPFAADVCEAGDVSGLKPPLPHTEAGGVGAAAVGTAGAVGAA